MPIVTQLVPSSMVNSFIFFFIYNYLFVWQRADGTWRKEVKVRAGQIPKALVDIRTSSEPAEEIIKTKKIKVKR